MAVENMEIQMPPNAVFGLLNIGFALLFMALNIPLIMRRVGRNRLYGVRIKKSFASEENWYAINAYGGKQGVLWSLPILVAGIACFFIPITDQNKDVMSFAMGLGPIGVCLASATIKILAYAKKL
jgi:hypothetical protein